MLKPDRWDKRCPKAIECSRAELIDFLDVGAQLQEAITDWERDFCRSARRSMKYTSLSMRQMDTLDNGLLRKIWRNDPDLWR